MNCSFGAKELYEFSRGLSAYEATNRSGAVKIDNFHLMQRHFADIMRCVAFCNIYLSGFLMTQRQMTLKDVWVYNFRKLHQARMSDAFSDVTI